MKCIVIVVTLGMFATTSSSEELSLRSWENSLSYEQAKSITSGHTLTFPGFSKSEYYDNRSISFIPNGGGETRFGVFEVRKDGRVCVHFEGKHDRCALFLTGRGVLFELTEEGDKLPVYLDLGLK